MRVAHTPAQVERQPRAVAVGSFDGVHRGHVAVLEAARATGLAVTAITLALTSLPPASLPFSQMTASPGWNLSRARSLLSSHHPSAGRSGGRWISGW